jgi:hypothetical protein
MDLRIERERLSDGSSAYNVICENGNGDEFIFRCTDEIAAYNLIKIMEFSVVSLTTL